MSDKKSHLLPPQVVQRLEHLNIKLFADGANPDQMRLWQQNPYIKGFTTNPSLMRAANIDDYETFARNILKTITHHPISFEVFSDTLEEMEQQARYIASWGNNVNIKIPVMNTRGEFMGPLIERLSTEGICLNVTAIMTLEQVQYVADSLNNNIPAIISIFAGRIADTGIDPVTLMRDAVQLVKSYSNLELLWASSREILNIFQADQIGCHIITVSYDILKKASVVGKDLNLYSLDTVKQFYNDACMAGYQLMPM